MLKLKEELEVQLEEIERLIAINERVDSYPDVEDEASAVKRFRELERYYSD